MKYLRPIAGTLAPLLVMAECVPALEYRNGAWGAPAEQSHYHVPEENRGEVSFSIEVPSVSGTNSTVTMVSHSSLDSCFFSPNSFQESSPSPTIIIRPRSRKTRNEARVVITSFPARQQSPRQRASFSAPHPRPVAAPNVKRFLFRRP